MSRRSTKTPPASRRGAIASRRTRLVENANWGVLRRGTLALVWLSALAGLAAGWVFAMPSLGGYAMAGIPDARSTPPMTVTFHELPAWLQGDPAIDLDLLVRECVGPDPLDRESLVRAREALLNSGWFTAVAQVRRTGVGSVEVVGSFVDPAALVRAEGRDWLVEAQGRLLPISWPSGQGPELAVITGVRAAPPRRVGDFWPGTDLAAALAVLAVIDRQPWARQVEIIDLGHYARDRTVLLRTDRDTTIRWGRAPGAERGAEVSTAMKLDFLRHHFGRYGHIDGGLRGEVDVSQDVAVVRGGGG